MSCCTGKRKALGQHFAGKFVYLPGESEPTYIEDEIVVEGPKQNSLLGLGLFGAFAYLMFGDGGKGGGK